MNLSWEPVRRGDLYCAPACGGRCKYATYLKAKRRATATQKHLGRQWKIRIYENLGWHWSVHCAGLSVCEGMSGDYSAYLDLSGDTHCGGQYMASDRDPKKAILKVVKQARETMCRIERSIIAVKKAVNYG